MQIIFNKTAYEQMNIQIKIAAEMKNLFNHIGDAVQASRKKNDSYDKKTFALFRLSKNQK